MLPLFLLVIHGGPAHAVEAVSLAKIVVALLVVAVTVGIFVAIGSRVESFSDQDSDGA